MHFERDNLIVSLEKPHHRHHHGKRMQPPPEAEFGLSIPEDDNAANWEPVEIRPGDGMYLDSFC